MKQRKSYLVIILLVILYLQNSFVLGQNLPCDDCIDHLTPLPSNNYYTFKARECIRFLPNFSYAATQNTLNSTWLSASIDKHIICDPFYIENPDTTRQIDLSLPVGSIVGTSSVSNVGAAEYLIPILVPPGTANLQPSLSISYNSFNPSGLMGIGWNLNGLSAIYRTTKDFYHDNFVKEVDLSNAGPFSLDGNRLIVINGPYGEDLSEYRTENETFAQIISHKSNGIIQWFEVKTKDGMILEYGNSESSQVRLDNNSQEILFWRINKIIDNNGNYVLFNYNNSGNYNGESWIQDIQYTGNSISSLEPYNKIQFQYQKRTDKSFAFVSGYKIPQTVLLTTIRLYCGDAKTFSKFDFFYTFDSFSKLSKIIETGNDGSNLNSTIFTYGNRTDNFSYTTHTFNFMNKDIWYFPGDYNGDGKTDLLIIEPPQGSDPTYSWFLYFGNTSGGFTTPSSGDHGYFEFNNIMPSYTKVGDLNGDGRCDLLCYFDMGSGNHEYMSFLSSCTELQGLFSFDHDAVIPTNDNSAIVRDFDGDGIDDILTKEINGNCLPYRVSSHYFENGQLRFNRNKLIGTLCSSSNIMDVLSEDINGDKGFELIIRQSNSAEFYKLLLGQNLPSPWVFLFSSPFPESNLHVNYADFNGDNKCDILYKKSNSTTWSLQFSTGSSFSDEYVENFYYIDDYTRYLPQTPVMGAHMDFNHDGYDDFIQVGGVNQGQIIIYYSNGDGTFTSESEYTYQPQWCSGADTYLFGDGNGDGSMDLWHINSYTSTGPVNALCYLNHFHKDEKKFLLHTIITGYNTKIHFSYKPLTNTSGNFYSREYASNFPLMDFQKPFFVVSGYSLPNGIGGQRLIDYNYENAKYHVQGNGFLGFNSIKSYDHCTSLTNTKTNDFNLVYYFPFLINDRSEITNGGITDNVFSTSQNISINPFSDKRKFVYVSSITQIDYLKNNQINSEFLYDNYGNVTNSTLKYGLNEDVKIEETNAFIATGGNIFPNKLSSSTVTKTYKNQDPYSQSKSYTYDSHGNLLTCTSNPSSQSACTVTYTYIEPYGVISATTTSASGLLPRSLFYSYDNKYRLKIRTTNSLNHSTSNSFNFATGDVLEATDFNGNRAVFKYDGYNRQTSIKPPFGGSISISYNWVTNSGHDNSLYVAQYICPGNPVKANYFDDLNRMIEEESNGFSGELVSSRNVYNCKGELEKNSHPHYESQPERWVNYMYDKFGRMTDKADNGTNTNVSYNGLITTTVFTDSPHPNVTKSIEENALGDVIKVTDGGGEINYVYHSCGKPKTITSPGNVNTTIEYDSYGRRIKLIDPDAGESDYTYNAYNELITQKNANDFQLDYQYDELGRIVEQTRSFNNNVTSTTNYSYVTQGNGVEQIENITSSDNCSKLYFYDKFGRITSISDQGDGQNFVTSYQYNSNSKVEKITYPSGLIISEDYNAYGYLNRIRKDSRIIWSSNIETAIGQPQFCSYGNSFQNVNYTYDNFDNLTELDAGDFRHVKYSFTGSGNLNWKQEIIHSNSSEITLEEDYLYDSQERLQNATILNGQTQQITYTNNNILSKTSVGNYFYSPIKPHSVVRIEGNIYSFPSATQNITFNNSNRVSNIQEGANEYRIYYGPNNIRFKTLKYQDNLLKETKYFSNNYEKIYKNGNSKELNYIYSSSGLVAIYVNDAINGDDLFYVCTDYQGSIIAMFNENGTVERFSFDPWGRRRNTIDWSSKEISLSSICNRGYLGQEHLDEVGLIDLNARLYDPQLAEFISPDPFIQSPTSTQNFNRYTYGLNNPLKYSDPNGEWIEILIGAAVGGALNVVTHWNDIHNPWEGVEYFGAGAIGGALGAGISAGMSSLLYYNNYGQGSLSGWEAFTKGFTFSNSTHYSTGFFSGATSASIGGLFAGFATGFGNGLLENKNILNSALQGIRDGGIGYQSGFLYGGVTGGLDAANQNKCFWNGADLEFVMGNEKSFMSYNTFTANITSKSVKTDKAIKLPTRPNSTTLTFEVPEGWKKLVTGVTLPHDIVDFATLNQNGTMITLEFWKGIPANSYLWLGGWKYPEITLKNLFNYSKSFHPSFFYYIY